MNANARHKVTLVGKSDCHLCHEARELLEVLREEFDFDWVTLDIEKDAALAERYRYTIPVIIVDEKLELEAPIIERELRAALR